MSESQQPKAIGCGTLIAIFFGIAIVKTMLGIDGGNSGSSGSSQDRKISAWVMAQQFVKDKLKSPSSANFGSVFGDDQDPNRVVSDLGDGKFRVQAWVDAQNAFGGTVRTPFKCELEDTGGGNWRRTSLQMSE